MSIISMILVAIADLFSNNVSVPWWLYLLLGIVATIDAARLFGPDVIDIIIDFFDTLT